MTGRAQAVQVTANLELDPWLDINLGMVVPGCRTQSADLTRVGLVPDGTSDHRATVAFVVRLPSGELVLAETTLATFRAIAAAVLASPVAQMDNL